MFWVLYRLLTTSQQHSTALEMKCPLWINATIHACITEKENVVALESHPVVTEINWKNHTDVIRLCKKPWILVGIEGLKLS